MDYDAFRQFFGPACFIFCLLCALRWLARPVPMRSMVPWPGIIRASLAYNSGRRRATVIQEFPGALARYYWYCARDWATR